MIRVLRHAALIHHLRMLMAFTALPEPTAKMHGPPLISLISTDEEPTGVNYENAHVDFVR